ncbi:DUF881 domain-containing protein [Aureibacillus halotolerans]|uniref:Uncharacterized protein YlxW (UPF0749 family) n=1 Tax=Aureibacillus halotolerans TaxID=1508390 RepID=A0A4R6U729_9BACI|nr:DUF881 domain-containing protein [Aureibacillus halotolerans]TDQ42330.1 uncharacterized protein YlxW (UPF0749 family) [Aureibacillus halotolerans]
MKNVVITFTVAVVLGLLLAVQFNTSDQPEQRDTRDSWQLREDLQEEQQLSMNLLDEITKYENTIRSYSSREEVSREKALRQTLMELKKEAGLTEVKGKGIVLRVDVLFDENLVGLPVEEVSPVLLIRLVNELNRYGADAIDIAGHRLVSTSPIRTVNGETYVNNKPLPPYPFEIKVITAEPDKLHAHMMYSKSVDEFARDNFSLHSSVQDEVTVQPYSELIRMIGITPVEEVKGES